MRIAENLSEELLFFIICGIYWISLLAQDLASNICTSTAKIILAIK